MSNILLNFTKSLLDDIRIHTYDLALPFHWEDNYDLGLRKTLIGSSYEAFKDTFLDLDTFFQGPPTIALGQDSFDCYYLLIPAESSRLILAGPFLTETLTLGHVAQVCQRLNIPDKYHTYMKQYYATLPVLEIRGSFHHYLVCLGRELFKDENFEPTYLRGKHTLEFKFEAALAPEPNINVMKTLENRYDNEEKLMESIALGDFEAAEKCLYDRSFANMEQRVPDTIRDQKNYLIITNTLFRKAAKRGKVHPIYLDELSGKMAAKIEALVSLSQVEPLRREMVRKYCFLVKTHSTKGFSPIIQKILNYIAMNLASDLTLKHLSSIFSLNSSYLSAMFKKETGTTLTSYVNNKRIDRAVYLLNTQVESIQDIAILCGIPDLTYFTKLFKKVKGMTPTKYRELITRKAQ